MAGQGAAQASFLWDHGRLEDGMCAAQPAATHPSGALMTRAEPELAGPPAADAQLPPDNELWDVRAASKFLKRSVSWVYHKAEDGTLPVKRLDGWGVRFVPAELRAWVVEHNAGQGRRR